MKDMTLQEMEEDSQFQDDYAEVPPSDIIAYNELRSCADLYRMHTQKILDVQPEFQRDVVWRSADQTRFIDSLIKQLPIPSMCFALDHREQKWIVIDGLQRISTIVRFLKGDDWKLSKLDDIDPELAGKSAAAIKNATTALHKFYTRVENLSIPITVLRCEFKKKEHKDYLFTIFHRLNTGGMKLNNQEIRNCIYGGSFNNLLHELDQNKRWRRINKMKRGNLYRYTKQELILRFFAFSDRRSKYQGHLAKFLNEYMHENEDLSENEIESKRILFNNVVDYIDGEIFNLGVPPKLPNTILEALLVAVGVNFKKEKLVQPNFAKKAFETMRNHHEFSDEALKEGLSKKQRVIDRLNTAIGIFEAD